MFPVRLPLFAKRMKPRMIGMTEVSVKLVMRMSMLTLP